MSAAPSIADHARQIVDAWPPLSRAQIDRIAVILRPRGGAAA